MPDQLATPDATVRTAPDLTSTRSPAVERVIDTRLPTAFGEFSAIGCRSVEDDQHHLALVRGSLNTSDVLVRVHSECRTGDIFRSQRCDCGEQLTAALTMIAEEGHGVLIYLAQEGRGIGLLNKLAAYNLQDAGADTVDANVHLGLPVDARDYGPAAAILADLGVSSVDLLTNNPAKVASLRSHDITVERKPLMTTPNPRNHAYLRAKAERMGHLLEAD